MDIVGEDQKFQMHTFGAQTGYEINGLRKNYVPVVVPMNEQHWGFPRIDSCHGRRVVRQLRHLHRNILTFPVVRRPVMHAVHIHASRKQIRIAAESKRRQISAVAPAPQSDAFRVHIGTRLQIIAGRYNVLVFLSASSSAAGRLAKRPAVADPAAVVDGQGHIPRFARY